MKQFFIIPSKPYTPSLFGSDIEVKYVSKISNLIIVETNLSKEELLRNPNIEHAEETGTGNLCYEEVKV